MYKKISLIAVIVLGFGIFSWRLTPTVIEYFSPTAPKQMSGKVKNNVQTKIIRNEKGFKSIKDVGLTPGVYDMTVESGIVKNLVDLPNAHKGEKYLGVILTRSSGVNIGEGEAVKFEPAAFEPLKISNGTYTITTPGNYVVNRQIPAGKYKVSMKVVERGGDSTNKYLPSLITVDSKFLNGDGGGDGQGGIISSNLARSNDTIVLTNDRLLSIGFSYVDKGSYVTLTPVE